MGDDNEFASEEYIEKLKRMSERDFKSLHQNVWIPPDDELIDELGRVRKPAHKPPRKRDHTLDNGRVVNVDYLPEPPKEDDTE